jgi:glutamate--cysteine ligase
MLVRSTPERFVPMIAPLTFGRWLVEGHELGYPTEDDLDYHLSTLFPPVRPRGWLEVRVIDALPDPWWQVAVAVTAALLDDPEASARAARATASAAHLWDQSRREGLGHPALAAAARECMAAALDALPGLGAGPALVGLVAEYLERYTARGRSPAHDRLAEWNATGRLFPSREESTAWT